MAGALLSLFAGSGRWRRWGRALRDVLFPPVCADCRRLVEGSPLAHLCRECARQVHVVHPPQCTTCGHPFFGDTGARACPHCVALEPAFREGRTALLFRGPVRTLVHEVKYHGAAHLLEDFGRLAAQAPGFVDFLAGAVLVPVPLHPRKERERGFNQAALLAGEFARIAPRARVVPALRRVADTQTQTRLDRKTRQANLKNAFALARTPSLTAGERIILVDDIFTTGATLNACAVALRRAGFVNLDVATFAHG